jgi:hypothetical protein
MGITDFSSAHQWKPFAEVALKQLGDLGVVKESVDSDKGARSHPASLSLAWFTKDL